MTIGAELDLYDAALIAELDKRYTADWELVQAEVPFVLDRTTHIEAGVVDGVIRRNGRFGMLERKTTSYLSDDYWKRLEYDAQTSTYFDALREQGIQIDFVLYEVQEIPSLSPLKATPEDKRKYTKAKACKAHRAALDSACSDCEPSRLYATQRATDESPGEFAVRVAEWADAEPRLHVREVSMTTQRLEEARADRANIAQLILAGYQHRNPAACVRFSTCDYLEICHRTDLETETPEGFKRLTDTNPELVIHV